MMLKLIESKSNMHLETELQITSRENDQSFMLQLGPLDYNIAHITVNSAQHTSYTYVITY